MKYAIFLGCNIPCRVDQYDSAARAVLGRLGVELIDVEQFGCCGYPLRNIDRMAFVVSSAANMAAAEKEGLDIIALCKCCFGSLKEAQHLLAEEKTLLTDVNRVLSAKGLRYAGHLQVKHLLSVLYHDVGIETIRSRVSKPFEGLNIATHYGCHALRPSAVTGFDDPVAPTLFDRLVRVTGAKSVEWTRKLECCGAPLTGINDDLSMTLTEKKIADGKKAGAHYLCAACPYCHLQFDTVQKAMAIRNGKDALAFILYPQLLGLCMDIDEETLGIGKNRLDITGVRTFIDRGEKNAEH